MIERLIVECSDVMIGYGNQAPRWGRGDRDQILEIRVGTGSNMVHDHLIIIYIGAHMNIGIYIMSHCSHLWREWTEMTQKIILVYIL